jgi:RNA polymerase sigma-70 factor (ECF subfamily)
MQVPENKTTSTITEEEQIELAKKNPAEFEPLYNKYYKSVFVFVYHRTGLKDLTADITSQVFLKALVHLPKYSYRGVPFCSWLFRIAVNEVNQFYRKNKLKRVVIIEPRQAEKLSEIVFADEIESNETDILYKILNTLNPEDLQIIELRYMEERPFKEVAEILGISENNAKVKVYRIIEKMRRQIKKWHEE